MCRPTMQEKRPMNRYVAYPDTSSGYIVVDAVLDRIMALYPDHRPAEHAARRLNELAPTTPPAEAADLAVASMMYQRHERDAR